MKFKNHWFWRRVEHGKESDCWPWTGCRNEKGYGQLTIKRKRYRAHRMALALSGTPVPAARVVMHICDNPPCCNPNHLRLATQSENIKDSFVKGRQAHVGAQNPNAKLSEEDVIEIRKAHNLAPRCDDGSRLKKGELSRIAVRFGVGTQTILQVVSGKGWSHV